MRLEADLQERLDRFLARRLPEFSRTKLAKLASEGEVKVNGVARKASFDLRPGDLVELAAPEQREPHDLTPAEIPLDIRYEDEHLLVVNKQRGLAVHPAASLKEPSLVNALLARAHELSSIAGAFRPGIVHRLDKDTTGLLVVAKSDAVHAKLAKAIEHKETLRRYVAVAAGQIPHERFTISAPITRSRRNRLLMCVDPNGRHAVTHLKRLALLPEGTLLAIALETGRTHQIRVHLQSMGHPVIGDRLYAPKRYQDAPLQLHAAFLLFEHPITQVRIDVYAEPPHDFLDATQVKRDDVETL